MSLCLVFLLFTFLFSYVLFNIHRVSLHGFEVCTEVVWNKAKVVNYLHKATTVLTSITVSLYATPCHTLSLSALTAANRYSYRYKLEPAPSFQQRLAKAVYISYNGRNAVSLHCVPPHNKSHTKT